ncbi:MAG: N-acetylglucosaminyl-phosphatidylinositol de-N-acetylase [Caeruleum heppii]|nr:MAG: N-acetylglucosaminyl-phosphatidylinositol de-N-acetylase [Caeruleum heppii]
MQWPLLTLLLPLLILTLWLYTSYIQRRSFPTLRNKRICLLIAHPDDEAMFFGPTLVALTARELGNHVKILCLSSGDADGLGETRKKELVRSALMLGLRNEDDVFVVEDPAFPDSLTTPWPTPKIANLLLHAFAPSLAQTPSSTAPTATIDVLLTFDAAGISSHPNHISLYHGALDFLGRLTKHHPGWSAPVSVYVLDSVSVVRKYLGVLDAPLSLVAMLLLGKKRREPPTPLVFVSAPQEWRRAQRAMTAAHRSQMRWFRWGWIGLSRYMVINSLRLVGGKGER